jgi:putative nucleotidyltransferase with HDIG domain
MPSRVLIVDDDEEVRSILVRDLADSVCQCVLCGTALEAREKILSERFSVVISDIRMPLMSGVELLRFVRGHDPEISVIMVTGVREIGTALETLRMGACDYITKPFDLHQVRRSVAQAIERNQLMVENRCYQQELELKVHERTRELNGALKEVEESYRITLEALVTALDAREHETQAHSQRVRDYAETLAKCQGVTGQELISVGRGALLHDVGKIGVPDSILLKPDKLTQDEWAIMQKHPRIGYEILQEIMFLSSAAEIVLTHQERWDGKGYPNGLAGNDIPLGARIFAVVDTMDAMTSDRPYRKALSFRAAEDEIRSCSGTQFDPMIVEAFLGIGPDTWITIHDAVNRKHQYQNRLDVLCRT